MTNHAPPPAGPWVEIWPTKRLASVAAAQAAAQIIRDCLRNRGKARILVATGNSQIDLINHLATEPGIDWAQVEALHLDEYVRIDANHPASFRRWIRERFTARVRPGAMHYIDGDAADLGGMLRAYSALLDREPLDLAFVGIGENGHIAFNDPPVADFNDPLSIKVVALDEKCRQQQVNEGHFPSIDRMPQQAATVTCSLLFRVAHWICCVPEGRKAAAVRDSLEGPVTTACPGSLVQKHPAAAVYLDAESAALLSAAFVAQHRCPPAGA